MVIALPTEKPKRKASTITLKSSISETSPVVLKALPDLKAKKPWPLPTLWQRKRSLGPTSFQTNELLTRTVPAPCGGRSGR